MTNRRLSLQLLTNKRPPLSVFREFTVTGGELSPSLKLKRFSVHNIYQKEIDKMYAHEGHSSIAW